MKAQDSPLLTGIAVHWHDEEHLRDLVEAWSVATDWPLLVVDNGSTQELPTECRILSTGGNLGFAAAVNLGLENSSSTFVLIMNTDVRPQPEAVDELLAGFERWPDAAALAPRLLGPAGDPQFRWQLRTLPTMTTLLLQALLLPVGGESTAEPEIGQSIEQPAAAALILRRQDLAKIGGFDEAFYPAWFEDVDLAFRMRSQGMTMRYCPAAQFTHHLGSSIPTLGYGPFLNAYYANLCRYLAKHHGRLWAGLARGLLVPAALLRIALLPLRRPSRVGSRREAVRGLWDLAVGAIKGWPPGFVDLPTAPVAAATGRDPR